MLLNQYPSVFTLIHTYLIASDHFVTVAKLITKTSIARRGEKSIWQITNKDSNERRIKMMDVILLKSRERTINVWNNDFHPGLSSGDFFVSVGVSWNQFHFNSLNQAEWMDV